MSISAVRAGMVGQGLTVARGQTPQPFNVEVLGVLKDGIGAGRNLIVVEVSDQAGRHVIDQGGGIWAGMSGSPVYVGGKLLGAVSYGFSASPSPIGAVTPAADMVKLLSPSTAGVAAAGRAQGRSTIPLTPAVRDQLASRATAQVPRGSLSRLALPLSVSGASAERLDRLQSDATTADRNVIVYGGSARKASTANTAMARPQAGGNFAAALSYGDVTLAGVGTTTAVCGKEALAFGHPLNWAGKTAYGAGDGRSLAIIKDSTFGPYKLADLGAPFGTLDQDRLAGIRARLGVAPATVPVVTTIRALDRGRARTGTTQVTDPGWLSTVAAYAVFSNHDSTFDERGDGRSTNTWTISGTRAGGKPFAVTRSNRWASQSDVALEPAFDVAFAVDAIVFNKFEKVKIQKVTYDSAVATDYGQSRITNMAVSVNGGKYVAPAILKVKAGDALKVKVTLRPYQSSATSTTVVSVKVPTKAAGTEGALQVMGGAEAAQSGTEESDSSCLLTGEGCKDDLQSLDAVFKSITGAPRNDDVVATLALQSESSENALVASGKKLQTSVVTGVRQLWVSVG